MITKMVDTCKFSDVLLCVIRKITPIKNKSTILQIIPCLALNKLATRNKDNSVTVTNLTTLLRSTLTKTDVSHVSCKLENITSLCWHESASSPTAQLCAVYCDGDVAVIEITEELNSRSKALIPKTTLHGLLQEHTRTIEIDKDVIPHVLAFKDDRVTIAYGDQIIVAVQIKYFVQTGIRTESRTRSPAVGQHGSCASVVLENCEVQVLSVIELGDNANLRSMQRFIVIDDILSVFDTTTRKLYLYSLLSGRLSAWYDFSEIFAKDTVQLWYLSPCQQIFTALTSDSNIVVVHVPPTGKKYGKQEHDGSGTGKTFEAESIVGLFTTMIGDSIWRQQLQTLHTQSTPCTSPAWLTKAGSSACHLENVSKKRSRFIRITKVTGGRRKMHDAPPEDRQPYLTKTVSLPDWLSSDWQITNITNMGSNVSMDLRSVSEHSGGGYRTALCTHNLEDNTQAFVRLSEHEALVLSRTVDYPNVTVTDDSVYFVLIGETQQSLLSKVTLHSGAATADLLCHLNGWDHYTIPAQTLEVGLRQRQLDTVAFYLKSKENAFTCGQSQAQTYGSKQSRPAIVFEYMEASLNLLVKVIQETANETSRKFGDKLLNISVNHLYTLTLDALAVKSLQTALGDEDVVQEVDTVLRQLLLLISKLRRCMLGSISNMTKSSTESLQQDVVKKLLLSDKVNTSRELELLVEDHLLKNEVALLQHNRHIQGHFRQLGSLLSLQKFAVRRAIALLSSQSFVQAKSLLQNVGFPVYSKLWEITEYTTDVAMRDFIFGKLKELGKLSSWQQGEISFLRKLGQHYPNPSVTSAVELRERDSTPINSVHLEEVCPAAPVQNVNAYVGPIFPSQNDSYPSRHYCEVLLHWLKAWDKKTRQKVLLESTFNSGQLKSSDYWRPYVWEFLLHHNHWRPLVDFIETTLTNPAASDKNAVEGLVTLSRSLHNMNCPDYVKCILRDVFSRYLATNDNHQHGDFAQAVQCLSRRDSVVHERNIGQHELHQRFAQYCIEHQLPALLWVYMDHYRLESEEVFPEGVVAIQPVTQSWQKLFSAFYTLAKRKHKRLEDLYTVSLLTSEHMMSSKSVMMDEDKETLLALITWQYAPEHLKMAGENLFLAVVGDIPAAELYERLSRFPKIYPALCPKAKADLCKADVTVYDLLSKDPIFCPSRLFGWQELNNHASEECMRDLPYFSHPGLIKQFGAKSELKFTYYLQRGRPCFAFVTFLAQELTEGLTTLPKHRIALACRAAVVIAVKHMTMPRIVRACVAFTMMLGEDVSLLQTLVHSGNLILSYRIRQLPIAGTDATQRLAQMKQNEVEAVHDVLSCLRHRRLMGMSVVRQLEEAILSKMPEDKSYRFSLDSALEWLPALLLSHHLQLPMCTVYLEECARAGVWMPFLTFGQLFQYPKEKLQELLPLFRNRPLREHLHYIIENAQVKSLNVKPMGTGIKPTPQFTAGARDVRSSLYHRIGLAKGKAHDNKDHESSSDEDELPAEETTRRDTDIANPFLMNAELAADDIFGVLFTAQRSPCPWKTLLAHAVILRNPLCAVLAACYQEAPRLACLNCWLVATMSVSAYEDVIYQYDVDVSTWLMKELQDIIMLFTRKHWLHSLTTGFDIFVPNCLLLPFFLFLAENAGHNYSRSKEHLETFKEKMITKTYRRGHGGQDNTDTLDMNESWVEQTVLNIIHHILIQSEHLNVIADQSNQDIQNEQPHSASAEHLDQSDDTLTDLVFDQSTDMYRTWKFVQILDEVNVAPIFFSSVPNFMKLSRILELIIPTGLTLKMRHLLIPESECYTVECQRVIAELQDKVKYVEALKFAELTGQPPDDIIIKQIESEFGSSKKSMLWQSVEARQKFWYDCSEKMHTLGVNPLAISTFFQEHGATATEDKIEQATLCELSYAALVRDSSKEMDYVAMTEKLYIEMWRCRIEVKLDELQSSGVVQSPGFQTKAFRFLEDTASSGIRGKPMRYPRKQFLQHGRLPKATVPAEEKLLMEQEEIAFDELLGNLLDEGEIEESCKVATAFSHHSNDLICVLYCLRLASGLLSVDDVTSALDDDSATFSHSARKTFATVSPEDGTFLSEEAAQVVTTMCEQAAQCRRGHLCCVRIISAYKVSQLIQKSYEWVVKADDFVLLEALLKTGHEQCFHLAVEFLQSSLLTTHEVSGFVADAYVNALQTRHSGVLPLDDKLSLFPQGQITVVFAQLMMLCNDPSVLGDRLLDAVAAIMSSDSEMQHKSLAVQTDLLISAHGCHTSACSMEGISNVLRSCRVLSDCLVQTQEYTLMITLLIGVGRFSEMSYIFDTLKQNAQFELLLRKGMELESGLKVAILDYLKRYHPADRDTYTMVALKFRMYREIAEMLAENARLDLDTLKGKSMENSSDVKRMLQKIVQYFFDAAESYLMATCMRQGQICIKQARLVALQLQHLSSGIQVINLTDQQAMHLIRTHPKFSEAYVMNEAYGRRDQWPDALLNNYVLGGDSRYLQDFKSYIRLTPTLIQDILDKFEQQAVKASPQAITNVKKLLKACTDVKLRYQLAKELGFHDVLEEIDMSDSGAYLQDMFI